MADLGTLFVSLGFDPNQIQNASKQAGQQSANAFNQSFKSGSSALQSTISQALNSTGVVGKKAGSQFLGSLKSSLKSQMNSFKGFFDSAMGNIFKGGLLGIGFALGRSLITGIQNAISAGIGAIKNLITSSISIGEERQASRNRLIAISGSAQQAAQDFNFVKDAAMRLNNDLNPLLGSFEKFVQQARAVGLSAKEYQKIWEGIAQAATASQQADRIPDLLQVISKEMLRGTISSMQFRKEIANGLPGALEAMQRATGKTGEALDEFLDSGVARANDLLPRFAQELLNITAPNLAQHLKGAANEAGNIGGLMEAIKGTIGEAIVPVVGAWRKAIADVLGVIYKNVKGFDSLQDLAQKFADKLAANPKIVETIGNGISDLINRTLEGTINLASSFTDYLNKNPDTINKIVDGLTTMTKILTDVVELSGKFLIRLSDAATELETLRKGADRSGLDSFVAQNENISPERYAELEQQAREQVDQKLGLSHAPSFLANIQRNSGLYRNMVTEELQKLVQDEIESTSARVRSGQLARPGERAPGVRWHDAEQYSPGWQALLTPLFEAEGTNTDNGYRTNFGGEIIDSPNGHPRQLVTSNGISSDAYGQWQWMSPTWDDVTRRYGLDPTDMSQRNQMRAGMEYFQEAIFANGIDQATLDAALSGDIDAAMKVWNAASARWPSLPGGSQQNLSTDEFVRMYQSIIGTGAAPATAPWDGSYYSDPISEDLSLEAIASSPEPTPAFASPLAHASPQQVQNYLENDITDQQNFWASRDGGNRTHSGVDLDYRVAGGDGYTKGDIVQSILPGIATLDRQFGTGQDGDASVMVRVVSQDSAGNEQAIEYGHLSLADVIDQLGLTDFGQSIAVEAGQAIGRIGTVDNLSSGAHLDLKWSVNGRYVDPAEAFNAISSGTPGTATSVEGASLPIYPVLGDQDPNAIFRILDEAENARQRILQETRANQDEALRNQREQEDAARDAELKRQQIELDRISQQFQGTSVSPFLNSQLETISVNNQYNEEIIRLQREQEDLQTELDRTLSDRMDEAGIQIYVDSLRSAIAQTEDLLSTTEELRQAELNKIAEARQQLTEETLQNQKTEQAQQLAEVRATTANLESQRQIESTNSEVVKQLMSLSAELASISAEYDQQTQALQRQIEDLTSTMDKLNSVEGLEIDSAALEILNNELNHTNEMLDELEEQRTIQIDIVSAQQQQLFDNFRDSITSDLMDSQIQAASLRGDTELQNRLQRDQARLMESTRYSSQLDDISALEATGNYSADAIAQMRREAELLNQINLDSINRQFQSLGEQITGSVGQSFSDFFTSIISGTQSVGDAFKGLLNSILNALMNFLSNKLLSEFMNSLFPTPTAQPSVGESILGIGTSLFGGLIGGGGFTGNVVSNGILAGLTPFANGGIVSSATPALVGEAGAEAIIPLKGGAVPVSLMGGGGSMINVPVSVNIESNSGNVDVAGVKRLIENTITEKLSRETRPGGLLNK